MAPIVGCGDMEGMRAEGMNVGTDVGRPEGVCVEGGGFGWGGGPKVGGAYLRPIATTCIRRGGCVSVACLGKLLLALVQ